MNAADIAGYTYDTENLCPSCTVESVAIVNPESKASPEEVLDEAAKVLGINRHDENTYDSSTFPKVIFADKVEDDERCAHCGEKL